MATEDLVQAASGPIAATQTFGAPDRYLAQMVAFKPGGPANAAPTVAAPADATPNPVAATTTNLSVLGADDGGEANLIYTWAPTGARPAPVTFSANGTNAAKNTVATFTKAGNYSFQVTIKDQGNLTAASSVNVTVKQTVTSITVAPATATVAAGATQQFTATASDQFNVSLVSQPSFNWTVSGGGTINASGLFTAGNSAGGPFTVTAASSGASGTANVTVTGPPPVISSLNPTSAVNLFPGSGSGTQTLNLTVNGTAFVNGAVVTFDTINTLSTIFISSGQLTATIPPAGYYLWLSGKHSVQVVNPDGGKSNIAYFDALPSVTSLSPSSANAGGPSFTLVLNVTGVFLNVVVNFGSTYDLAAIDSLIHV